MLASYYVQALRTLKYQIKTMQMLKMYRGMLSSRGFRNKDLIEHAPRRKHIELKKLRTACGMKSQKSKPQLSYFPKDSMWNEIIKANRSRLSTLGPYTLNQDLDTSI